MDGWMDREYEEELAVVIVEVKQQHYCVTNRSSL